MGSLSEDSQKKKHIDSIGIEEGTMDDYALTY